MTARLLTANRVGDSMTRAAGSVAGAVVDPKTGWKRLRGSVPGSRLLVLGAALAAAFLAGRASVRR
ncbi:hypothetical protein GCM10009682_23620 [Luedemannella flava]|uniref:Uncharacterized protein n=1 Tax=Luedemannella flava TaxID=349316 RepID=A0ABN2LW85_9ACTN